MSKFGWSYPPGCSGPPDEDYDDTPEDEATDRELMDACDPYGELEFAIGSGDDFVCFDYAVDEVRRRIALAATVNSETGGFIDKFRDTEVYPFEEAPAAAARLVSDALDWAVEPEEVRLDMKGWNQDPAYFWRYVRWQAGGRKGRRPARRQRQWYKHFIEEGPK